MRLKSLIVSGLLCLVLSLTATSQTLSQDDTPLFGDARQPGFVFLTAVHILLNEGQSTDDAISSLLDVIFNDQDSPYFNGESTAQLAADKSMSMHFITNMVTLNKVFDSTKSAIEAFPERASDIISIAVSMYPDYAQEIIDAAVLTGEILADDALLAAIAAGADPTAISSATAAGGPTLAGAPATPIGAGIGAGGTGGGDTTASTN